MPVTIGQSNQASDDPQKEISSPAADVPAWLAARRMRTSAASTDLPVVGPLPALAKSKSRVPEIQITKAQASGSLPEPKYGVKEWFTRQGLIGITVSLLVHTVVLIILACFIVAQVTKQDLTTIWGGMEGNSDDLGADLILESELPSDSGESAPLPTTEASQTLDSLALQGDIAESMRVGMGGNGNGEGESGDGTGMGVGAMKVPGYAQTKGSFSTWPDPRDPKPGQDYDIIIQIKLPGNITKIRGSDLSGTVIGTDGYRQAIRFKPNDWLPVEKGMVRIRIPVPGAARLVRDTIRVESKLIKEKQTFEIEF